MRDGTTPGGLGALPAERRREQVAALFKAPAIHLISRG